MEHDMMASTVAAGPSGGEPSARSSYASPASTSSNAGAPRSLALKISRLLSANLEDAGTKAALQTLDEFALFDAAAASAKSNADAVVATSGIKPRAATATSSATEGKNAKSRRLRAEIDKRLLDESSRFLDAFRQVNDKLNDLQSHLSSMHTTVDGVQAQLSKANSGTKHLLSSAASLRAERLATADKQAIVTVFLKRFTLSDREIKAMTSRDVPVGRELFHAIERTEAIRKDCRVLMGGDAAEEAKAGMEIMLQTSQYLDSAFLKLHKYTTFAARNYTTRPEVLDNVSPTLRRALQLLKVNRSDLLDDTLNILSATRSAAISNMFIEALTRGTDPGGPGGKGKHAAGSGAGMNSASRPIELHAHDPIRYVGDILAWVHQAMAGEREFLESLFGMKDSGRYVGAPRPSLPKDDGAMLLGTLADPLDPANLNVMTSDEGRLRNLLDKNLESCGRPLKIRIQQTIKSHSMISPITTYQIFQLLQFYRVLMVKTMGREALLCKILTELAEFANKAFFDTLEEHGATLLRSVTAPGLDLRPPLAIKDAVTTLKEIMQVYKQSLLDEEDRTELDDFDPVLDTALDPIFSLVDAMQAMKPQEAEKRIFDCNCTVFVQTAFDTFPTIRSTRIEAIKDRLQESVESLTQIHYAHLLKESGLEPVVDALNNLQAGTPLSDVPAASSRSLATAIRTFDSFLSHVDTLTSSRLVLLSSHRLAKEIHHSALERAVAAYGTVWEAVMDPANRYEFRSTVLHRSKEEVRTLLAA